MYSFDKFQDDVAANIMSEVIKIDELSILERNVKVNAEKTILNIANLIAPTIETTLSRGFTWYVNFIILYNQHMYIENQNIVCPIEK